mmetsp:Transcript_24781/g.54033  ORF Transcript_24781/g.54033 Transcript_24781/m.54033 type:complete len:479 (+) Transcript_24781:97-1533(+)|eukprot:CAMPEP_0202909772 /NCGR_PEP_ID=MMETSP1392-20130828/50265_1 /ASSEMBLY_ACC=CAM_ASM_000868 /TAXON_ID=225041 /ORGANISM="Chlamydomonas chlamydogama, Strain SAG 11-48b" /LENGTH=478 /DNA_ID=CAMNT_0049599637 /DNA_START=68 /DNA_END=1504 /DNA_ORIENTATION=-
MPMSQEAAEIFASVSEKEPVPHAEADDVWRIRSDDIEHLISLLNECPRHTIIDLAGQSVSASSKGGGECCYSVAQDYITLRNAMIKLPPNANIIVKAKHVALDNVTLEGQGVVGEGTLTVAQRRRGLVEVESGGQLSMKDCKVALLEARVEPQGCGCFGPSPAPPLGHLCAALLVRQGSSAELRDCDITSLAPYAGVVVQGSEARLTAEASTFHDTPKSCIYVLGGASASLTRIKVLGSQTSYGIELLDKGSSISLQSCDIGANAGAGVMVSGGAQAKIVNSELHDSLTGSGLQVTGAGSCVEASNSRLYSNEGSNLFVSQGASARLEGCELHRSKKVAGVTCRDESSAVQAYNCKMYNNASSSIVVGGGASAHLTSCQCSQSQKENGIVVQGVTSGLEAESCILSDNSNIGILVRDGSIAKLRDCIVQGNTHGVGTVIGQGSTVIADRCQFDGKLATQDGGVLKTDETCVELSVVQA